MAKSRRQGREAALRALYEIEIGKRRVPDAVADMVQHASLPAELEQFATELVNGVADQRQLIDQKLASYIRDWDFDRIAPIDKNLMRIATYELFFRNEIPPAVTINEAVELAKKYSTADSGKFVNGVLGRAMLESPKANWDPSAHVVEVEEPAPVEEEPEVENISPEELESKELSRVGLWKIKSEENG